MTDNPNPAVPVQEVEQTTNPAPETARKPAVRRKPAPRKSSMLKMVATPEIQARYEAACKRLEGSGEALNREVWEMVKTELESLYEFKTPKAE
ncbi:MAG TPA: hypothetical protein PKO06_17180 [Candidatus Ozemobacteraceae bacterium]|nr:hypothetical protein [Candidatus Ozemobacteraceae bacterium]